MHLKCCLFLFQAKCNLCGATTTAFRMEQSNKIFRIENNETTNETNQHYMTPIEVREHLSRLWKNDQKVIENVFGAFHDASMNEDQDKNKGALFSQFIICRQSMPVGVRYMQLFLSKIRVLTKRYSKKFYGVANVVIVIHR